MGGSLVLELQQLAQTGDTPLSELLRRAKVVAVKLSIDEARTWIEHEMDGYPDGVVLPPYRVVPCELRGLNIVHGRWMPVRSDEANLMANYFACGLMREPIAQIEEYAKGKDVKQASLPQHDIDILVQAGNEHLVNRPLARFYGRSSFVAILDAVRNKILDWSLALEKRGVRGEDMTFDDSEKANAAQIGFKIGPSARVLFLSANTTASKFRPGNPDRFRSFVK